MPIYEYRCTACGHELDAMQKISEPPLEMCPACGAQSLKKRISAVAFRLKGGGWYETDFKSGQQRNLAGDKGDARAQSEDTASGSAGGEREARRSGEKGDSGNVDAGKRDAGKPDTGKDAKGAKPGKTNGAKANGASANKKEAGTGRPAAADQGKRGHP